MITYYLISFSSLALLYVSGQRVPSVPNASNVRFTSDVNLTFTVSARGLPNGDPYIKIYSAIKDAKGDKIAESDVVKKSANPDFNNVFSYVWKRGTDQKLIFRVKQKGTFKDSDVGEVIISVDQYVLNSKENMVANLTNGKGSLLIRKTTPVRFRLYARNLPRMDVGNGMSDPWVKIFWRRGSSGELHKLAQTDVIDNVENADWPHTFEFPNYVKGSDYYLHFQVRDQDGVGKDDVLGDVNFELDPFVTKRQTKIVSIGKPGSGGTLGITPA